MTQQVYLSVTLVIFLGTLNAQITEGFEGDTMPLDTFKNGSEAGGMDTTARLDGDHFVLNGSKNWITHAISSNISVVIARTGEKGDSRGMTAFVIEKGTPGFSAGQTCFADFLHPVP